VDAPGEGLAMGALVLPHNGAEEGAQHDVGHATPRFRRLPSGRFQVRRRQCLFPHRRGTPSCARGAQVVPHFKQVNLKISKGPRLMLHIL
jgi:hypothetical protein